MADPLTHTDALAALLADPNAETCTVLPVALSCSVCGLAIPTGSVALVCVREDGVRAQASHRACRAVTDDADLDRWTTRDTLVDHLCGVCIADDTIDLPVEPALLDVVPDDLHDEWRAVWAALRGDA